MLVGSKVYAGGQEDTEGDEELVRGDESTTDVPVAVMNINQPTAHHNDE